MNFIISATTDVGTTKQTNQDSLTVKTIQTCQGRMVLAVLCDGMGGLQKGEVASASVVRAFEQWMFEQLPQLCAAGPIEDAAVRAQWTELVTAQNKAIGAYGARQGIRLGTTVVAVLLTQSRFYALNVGDSRLYELTDGIRCITQDQTVVAREVAQGLLTPEQARVDPRRNVLLQCVGASETVVPDFFFGRTLENAVYLLCSDGFRHEIFPEEIFGLLQPAVLPDSATMERNARALVDCDMQRGERDNISVALVRTF